MSATAEERDGGRRIVAASEAEIAAVFEDMDVVESVETGREDGTGNWASDRVAEKYEGHAYARVTVGDTDDTKEIVEAARDAGLNTHGIGRRHIRVCEGRPPLPENRFGMDAWDSIRVGDRFTVDKSVAYEAEEVVHDEADPEKVKKVIGVAVYKIERGDRKSAERRTFEARPHFGRSRRIETHDAYGTKAARIKEMTGEFIVPDADGSA